MGPEVKTHLPRSPAAVGLASGVHPRCAGELAHARVAWGRSRDSGVHSRTSCDSAMHGQRVFSIPVDLEAGTFSTSKWEPSFYQGLAGPLLCSALRGRIACPEGLRKGVPGPVKAWMLSPVTISSPGSALSTADLLASHSSSPETGYEVNTRRGSYLSFDRHRDSAIEAIWRAMVSFAKFGFVPPSKSFR